MFVILFKKIWKVNYMNQIKIGKFIAELRKEKNLTQQQLGDRIGVSDKTVSKWETGRGFPQIPKISYFFRQPQQLYEQPDGQRADTEDQSRPSGKTGRISAGGRL